MTCKYYIHCDTDEYFTCDSNDVVDVRWVNDNIIYIIRSSENDTIRFVIYYKTYDEIYHERRYIFCCDYASNSKNVYKALSELPCDIKDRLKVSDNLMRCMADLPQNTQKAIGTILQEDFYDVINTLKTLKHSTPDELELLKYVSQI